MDSFSAIGKPYKKPSTSGSAMLSMAAAETMYGSAAVPHLPVKFTDESLIPVPVLRPEDVGKVEPIAAKKGLFSSRRKSTNTNFIMKKIPRGEYLKFYAKDDDGKYIGTDEPAPDCILRREEDLLKYRSGASRDSDNISTADTLVGNKGTSKETDGVIR